MNRAAPLVRPDYSLSAPPRQVGRSMSDASRMNDIAMRRMRSQGDYQGAARLATNQQWLDARYGRGLPMPAIGAGGLPATMPTAAPMPMGPLPPTGKLVPGRSAGSMVWLADAPPPMAPAPDTLPTPMAPPMRQPEQPAADAMPMPAPDLTINPLTGLPFALATPNVPSGFMAQQAQAQNAGFPGLTPAPPGLYTEAPPPAGVFPLPGTSMAMVMKNGQPTGGVVSMDKPEAPLPPGVVPTEANLGGVTYKPQVPEAPAKMPKFQQDATSGKWFWFEPNGKGGFTQKFVDANQDGIPDAQQQPGAAGPTAGKTASGISFTLK